MKYIIFIIVVFTIYSCSDTSKDNQSSNLYQPDETNNDYEYITSGNNDNNYHTNSDYKYEYRTGNSGNYQYNYDISGSDEVGNSVSGNIDIQGKYGSGYIEDEYGNEKYIEVEWTDYGILEGSDEDGNYYDLEVD